MKILKNILIFIILFVIFLFKELFYMIPFTFLKLDYLNNSFINAIGELISYIVMILIIVFIYRKYLIEKFKLFRKNFNNYFDCGLKFWFLGLIGMIVFNTLILRFTSLGGANNEELVQNMIKSAPIFMFINVGFLGPFVEEMLFRKSLGDIFGNTKLMVFISGLFFGLLHVVFSLKTPLDLLYTLPYGILGASFAMMLYKTDNVYTSMTFHIIHNVILTLLSFVTMVL